MSNSCVKHPMTFGTQICGECGHHFCDECVVFPFGLKKPPVCISCALEMGGVSSRPTGRPKLSRQSIRARRAAQKRAQKAAAAQADQVTATGSLASSDAQDFSVEPGSEDPELVDSQIRWIDDAESIEAVPGAWSQTFR